MADSTNSTNSKAAFSLTQLFKQLIARQRPRPASLKTGRDRFQRFTRRARTVLTLAQKEAQRAGQRSISTDHLLLALLCEGGGVAALVLTSFAVDPQRVRQVVDERGGARDSKVVIGEIGLSPDAKHVIELAISEADQLNHNYIGTEHLLLGILNEPESVALLKRLGFHPQEIRTRTLAKIAP